MNIHEEVGIGAPDRTDPPSTFAMLRIVAYECRIPPAAPSNLRD
jgi:hypothetical protein